MILTKVELFNLIKPIIVSEDCDLPEDVRAEPSLEEMIAYYYNSHCDRDVAKQLAKQYVNQFMEMLKDYD